MSKKQVLLWALQVALFAALGALQFVDQNSGGPGGVKRTISVFIFDRRLLISLLLGLGFALLTGWKTLFYPRKRESEIRQKMMETMRDELLNCDKNNYRITIFKDAGLWKSFVIYARLLNNCFRCWRRGQQISRLKRGGFVYVWERLGTEHPHSKTFYYYAVETARDCQGVAGTVRQSLTDIVVQDLPYIEDIDLATIDLKNNRVNDTQKVKDYMSRSYIKDFETLKRLHRRPRHIYGNILNNNNGARGVLVIDSFLDQSFLGEDVEGRLAQYAIMIGATM